VIFLFLRSFRATIIPSVACSAFFDWHVRRDVSPGLQLNNLSLMRANHFDRLVVDDAIVMIENISRYIEEGNRRSRPRQGSDRSVSPSFRSPFSLIAVLIPLLFMGDIVGRLFREFAVTLASPSGLGVCALTLLR